MFTSHGLIHMPKNISLLYGNGDLRRVHLASTPAIPVCRESRIVRKIARQPNRRIVGAWFDWSLAAILALALSHAAYDTVSERTANQQTVTPIQLHMMLWAAR